MSTNSIYKILVLLFLASCGSGAFVQSKDICSLKRHWRDDIYQVKINGDKINSRWYLKQDAVAIAKNLSSREVNKCAPYSEK